MEWYRRNEWIIQISEGALVKELDRDWTVGVEGNLIR